jgi:phosphoribosylformylglycinamidine synthase
MLCVCEPDKLDEVLAVCARWEVHGTAVGEVTDSGSMRIYRGDELVGDVPVAALVDDCPVYELSPARPSAPLYPAPAATLASDAGVHETLLALLASPNVASRRPLFEQYDSIVQSRTVRRPAQADAAVLLLPDGSALGVAIDGNGRRVAADPRAGTIAAVLECAANLACVGAEPLGITNNLNFGNPEKPHVAWQLSESVCGLGEACRALGVPVTGGNVSLYNEGAAGPIYPTPVIGMVGRLPDAARAGRLGFGRAGDAIALAGWNAAPSLGAGELAKLRGEPLPDALPDVDLARERAVLEAIRDAVRSGALSSCHDIAEGGFLVALAESCLAGALGATVDLGESDDVWTHLFGERPGGFVVSGPRDALEALPIPVDVLGTVGGDDLAVTIAGATSSWTLDELRAAHDALARLFP